MAPSFEDKLSMTESITCFSRALTCDKSGKIRGTPYEHIDEDSRYTEEVREPEG